MHKGGRFKQSLYTERVSGIISNLHCSLQSEWAWSHSCLKTQCLLLLWHDGRQSEQYPTHKR